MLTQKVVVQILLAVTTLVAMGCSRDKDNKPSEAVAPDDVSEYARASCEYKYEEGGRAEKRTSSDVRSTYFKKNLDFALLNPVMGASGGETVRFAELQNVHYFKTSFRNTSNCEFTQALTSAPSDLAADFSKNDSSGSILGLYLALNSPHLPSTSQSAAILVRRDANKWVLVHEYAHHLFQIQRNAELGVQTEDIKTRLIRVSSEYDQVIKDLKSDNSPTKADKIKLASQKLIELNHVGLEFLREYLLEEMSIENVLAAKFETSEFKYVVAGQRLNGAAYTISSGKKAKEQFLRSLNGEIDQFLMTQWDMKSEDRMKVQALQSDIQAMTSEIDALSDKAKAFLRSKGLEFRGLSSVTGIVAGGERPHAGCSHQKVADEVEEFFKQRYH